MRHFPKEKRGALYKGHSDSIRLFTEWWADKYYIHISKILHTHTHTHTHTLNKYYIHISKIYYINDIYTKNAIIRILFRLC